MSDNHDKLDDLFNEYNNKNKPKEFSKSEQKKRSDEILNKFNIEEEKNNKRISISGKVLFYAIAATLSVIALATLIIISSPSEYDLQNFTVERSIDLTSFRMLHEDEDSVNENDSEIINGILKDLSIDFTKDGNYYQCEKQIDGEKVKFIIETNTDKGHINLFQPNEYSLNSNISKLFDEIEYKIRKSFF
jgi:hypothetical protein